MILILPIYWVIVRCANICAANSWFLILHLIYFPVLGVVPVLRLRHDHSKHSFWQRSMVKILCVNHSYSDALKIVKIIRVNHSNSNLATKRTRKNNRNGKKRFAKFHQQCNNNRDWIYLTGQNCQHQIQSRPQAFVLMWIECDCNKLPCQPR